MVDGLFLYGTLTFDPLFALIAGAGDAATRQPATLPDHAVDIVAGDRLPLLIVRKGVVTRGHFWTGLDAQQRLRLDTYELAFGYELRPVTLRLGDGSQVSALAYFPPPKLGSAGHRWVLADWIASDAAITLRTAEELARHDPPLAPAALLRQWKMIAGRAHASHRAATTPATATLRHAAAPGDFTVAAARPLAGDFFKYAALDIGHRRFDSSHVSGLRREVLVGADAALVLPYDAVRDKVLLVEQFRSAVARRGDPNPWCLEPVAGMIDAGETPEQAAHRETVEEAGLTLLRLERMFAIYASPGSTTDHFYCYLGLADLPDDHQSHGGLAEEAEDLRLHVIPLDHALSLIDSGEVNAGPLIAMLLWLVRHRDRLRQHG